MNDKIYRQADNIITRKVMKDILLVPISGDIAAMDNIFSLNRVGYFIWQQLDGATSVAAVSEAIEANFDASEATIQDDLVALLADLSDRKLIVEVKIEGGGHDSND